MKIGEVMEIPSKAYSKIGNEKYNEAERFVSSFWEEFKKLAGSNQGKVIELAEPNESWPGKDAYRSMDKMNSVAVRNRINKRIYYVMRVMNKRKHAGFKHVPKFLYLGDGKILLYWKMMRKRVKRDKHEAVV